LLGWFCPYDEGADVEGERTSKGKGGKKKGGRIWPVLGAAEPITIQSWETLKNGNRRGEKRGKKGKRPATVFNIPLNIMSGAKGG